MWEVLQNFVDIGPWLSSWKMLADTDSECTVFQRPEWIAAWLHHFQNGRQVRIYIAHDSGKLTAVFPMWIRSFRSMRVLEFIGARGTDYLAPVVGCSRARIYNEFLDMAITDEINIISLEDIPEDHSLVHHCRARPPQTAVSIRTTCPCFQIDLQPSWEEYLYCLSRRKRQEIGYDRRYFRRKCPDGGYVPDTGMVFLDKHIELHQNRRRGLGHIGTYASVQSRRFLQEVAGAWSRDGLLRVSVLNHRDSPIASILAAAWRNREYALTFGMDTAWAGVSPGSILLGYCIENAITHKRQIYDLSRGPDQYKTTWGARAVNNVHVILGRTVDAITTYNEERISHFMGHHFAPSAH